MCRIYLLFSIFALAFTPAISFASLTDQEILLSPSPAYPLGKSQVAVIETTTVPAPQKFSVGLGSGVNSFGGNIGKLYNTSSPVAELRGEWAYLSAWAIRIGGEIANYSFNAEPNGAVNVTTQSLSLAQQAHFLSTALANEGFDPFVSVSGQWLSRTQNFQAFNSKEKDNAIAIGAGIGTNYLIAGGKLGFWAEAGINKIFFQDRFEQEYLETGIEDTTGPMYSGRLGMKYLF